MLPFGVTFPATVPQGSEIPEGLMNNPVYIYNIYIYGVFTSYSISLSDVFIIFSQRFALLSKAII